MLDFMFLLVCILFTFPSPFGMSGRVFCVTMILVGIWYLYLQFILFLEKEKDKISSTKKNMY